jgi:hypothetical protein
MDTEGARALAERIASGPPQNEGEDPPERPSPEPNRKVEPQPKPAPGRVEIVHLKPAPAPSREVRIYVRGPHGGLERRS